MARIVWDEIDKRIYETGVDRGVLYLFGDTPGVPWPGLLSISESPSGGEPRPYYFDGHKYLNVASSEEFEATLEALSNPPEFDACDGLVSINNGLFVAQQPRRSFNLSYRTLVGNIPQGIRYGYKIHIVYDILAAPTQRTNQSIGGSTDPIILSWSLSTRPPTLSGYKPTSHYIIDSNFTPDDVMLELTDILYGTVENDPRLPTVTELIALFS